MSDGEKIQRRMVTFDIIFLSFFAIIRSTAMIPDYKKGKESAIRILNLNNRQSKIDPKSKDGIVLVSVQELLK